MGYQIQELAVQYVARTPRQLGEVLKAFRKNAKLSQMAVGAKVGLRQATISSLETQAELSSVESLFKALSALDLDLAVIDRKAIPAKKREW